mmetsp:Transcript_34940/g.84532  ORF Transcript_34940/g.84532 Transcript_34940/m.84532 type:complete len:555 (+) Transcript_34940:195-1859(+)
MTTITDLKRPTSGGGSSSRVSSSSAGRRVVSSILFIMFHNNKKSSSKYSYIILYCIMVVTLTTITMDWVRLRTLHSSSMDDHIMHVNNNNNGQFGNEPILLHAPTYAAKTKTKTNNNDNKSITTTARVMTMTTAIGSAASKTEDEKYHQYKQYNSLSGKNAQHEKDTASTLAPTQNYADSDLLSQPYVDYRWLRKHKPRKSPYEIRYPTDMGLPYWAKKANKLLRRPLPPEDKAVCFVHIGKTGGSTVGCTLGFRTNCSPSTTAGTTNNNSEKQKLDDRDDDSHGGEEQDLEDQKIRGKGKLPRYTTHMVHNGVNDCADNMPYYLFTLRDPLQRIQSAYTYDRHAVHVDAAVDYPNDDYYIDRGQNSLYVDCPFYTLNDLAVRGLAKDGPAPEHCKLLARDVIQGVQRAGYHLYYNHRWFLNATNALDDSSSSSSSNSKILVIRMKHMIDDWNTAEDVLSVDESNNNNNKRMDKMPSLNEGGKKTTKLYDDQHLSPEARVLLCEALCPEILEYRRIVTAAVNLSPDDKTITLNELSQSCPTIADATSCDDDDED